MIHSILISLISITLSIFLSSCGGGGGGGSSDFVGAAQVQITAVPTKIDTGDRMRVAVRVDSLIDDGIALKIKFPPGLLYVPESSLLTIGKDELSIEPTNYITQGNFSFLVYYFSKDLFGKRNEGVLTLNLQGRSKIEKGSIEVDADVDDPRIDNASEFDITNPEFTAEDEVRVEVSL